MEFTIPAGDLAAAIGVVKGIIPTRTTLPILGNILIQAKHGFITVTASSLDMQASTMEKCEVITEGSTTIPGNILFGLVKALPKTKLATIKLEDGRAHLTCGKSHYNLRSLPVIEFPVMPVDDDAAQAARFKFKGVQLRAALAATSRLPSSNEATIYYQGVLLRKDAGRLAFAAADGHRFARLYTDPDADLETLPDALIPVPAVTQIANIVEDDDEVRVSLNKSRIWVKVGGTILTSKLINAKFPGYEGLIIAPKGGVIVEAGMLAEAIDRLQVVYSGIDVKAPFAVLQAVNGTIEINAGQAHTDLGSESVEAEILGPFHFSVSVRDLSEMLSLWPSKAKIRICAETLGIPALITSDDVPDQTHILMPMNPGRAMRKSQETAAAA